LIDIFKNILCCPRCREKLYIEAQKIFCPACHGNVLLEDRFIDFGDLNQKLHLDLHSSIQEITERAGEVMNDIEIDWRIDAVLKDVKRETKGSVCLEIGGADGPMTPIIENLFDTTLTLDYSTNFLERIKNKTQKTFCIYSDAHFLPIQNNVLDMTICCEVLEHSTIPTQLLTELKRTIKKNGIIILSVPNEQILYYRKRHSSYHCAHASDTHINFFTQDGLEKLLFRTGLEIIQMKTISPPIRSIRSFFGNLKGYIKRCFSGSFIVCIAKPMENPRMYWESFYDKIRS